MEKKIPLNPPFSKGDTEDATRIGLYTFIPLHLYTFRWGLRSASPFEKGGHKELGQKVGRSNSCKF